MTKLNRMEMPYKHFAAKKSDTSKPYFMISELIDNSIGSWNDNGRNGDLKIDISFDDTLNRITVVDNAFGMNEHELSESMTLNKEKAGDSLNMFGVGMKNAAFWFGEDLIVETNNGEGSWRTDISLSKIKDLSKTIEWTVTKFDRENRGTKVIIDNVHRILTNTEFEEMANVIRIKYQDYMKKGVQISIVRYLNNGGSKHPRMNSFNIKTQVIPENKKEEFLKQIETYFEGKILKYFKDLKEKTIELVEGNKPLKFKNKIDFLHEGKRKKIEISVGIQDETNKLNPGGFKAYYGLVTMQGGRAINLPPISALDFTNDYIRTNAKRLYGNVELGHIFKPDNNKQEFNFGEHKDDVYGMFRTIGSEIEIVADIVQDIIGVSTKAKSGNIKSSAKKIENALSSKSSLDWKINTEGADFTIQVDNGKKAKIVIKEISIEDQNNINYFINAEKDGQVDNTYIIRYNVNHPIWKPLTEESGNNIDTKIVTYPLVAIIGVSSLGIKGNIISDLLGEDYDETDILSILNFISKVIIK